MQRRDKRAIRVDRFLAAAQDGGVAGLEAEDRGVDGDVGARLKNDRDDADGDADLRDFNSVGAFPLGHLLAEGLGQGAHLAHAGDHGGERFFRDAEPVDHRLGQARFLGGGDVLRIGSENVRGVLLQLHGDFIEHLIEARGGERGEDARRHAGFRAEGADLRFGRGEMSAHGYLKSLSSRACRGTSFLPPSDISEAK